MNPLEHAAALRRILSPTGPLALLTALSSPLIRRKLLLARLATARDRAHRHTTPLSQGLNNRPTDIKPCPPPDDASEMSIRRALIQLPIPAVHAAIDKELTKLITTYDTLKPINRSSLEPAAVFLRSKILMKEKLDGRITARLAIDGSQQPPSSYADTHAGTSKTTHRTFLLACYQANCAKRGILHKLRRIKFDVPAAFLTNRLTRQDTGGHQIVTRMPDDIPPGHIAAPRSYHELLGALYGLKQSNYIFNDNFISTVTSSNFLPTPSDPLTFFKPCPLDPQDSLSLNMHVDDGEILSQSDNLVDEMKDTLTTRYGPIEFEEDSTGICGVHTTLNADRSLTLSYGPYLRNLLRRAGMDKVPPALTPSLPGFFDDPTDTTLIDPTSFRSINGALIFTLPLRHDVHKEITHLCSRNKAPTVSDGNKQLQVLRYLKPTTDLGPTLSSDPAAYDSTTSHGVSLYAVSDASHACHPDGRSQSAYLIGVGLPGASSPFLGCSSKESASVSLSPTESEYVTLSRCARDVLFYRQYASDIGFPQARPTPMFQDNQPAINLATAHQVPTKSRHIAQRHHFLRWLHSIGQVSFHHQGTNDIAPDGMTKPVTPNRFLFLRSLWFNSPRPSLPAH